MAKGCQHGILKSSSGTSGPTFQGVVNNVKLNRPKVVVLENVPAVGKPEIVCQLWDAFAALGYFGDMITVISTQFALPQSRERVIFFLLDAAAMSLSQEECEALCAKVLGDVKKFVSQTLPLKDFLFPRDHKRVLDQLAHRQLAHRAASDEGGTVDWPKLHNNFLQTKGPYPKFVRRTGLRSPESMVCHLATPRAGKPRICNPHCN